MDRRVRNSLVLMACLASVVFGAPPGAPAAATAGASTRTPDGQPGSRRILDQHYGYSDRAAQGIGQQGVFYSGRSGPNTPTSNCRSLSLRAPTPTRITIWRSTA